MPKWFPGFNHVYVFGVSERKGKQQIVQTEMLVNYCFTGVVWVDDIHQYLKILKKQGVTVVKCDIKPRWNKIQIYPRLNPFNCVELTKMLIGINLWGVYTPNKLYKALVKRTDCSLIVN